MWQHGSALRIRWDCFCAVCMLVFVGRWLTWCVGWRACTCHSVLIFRLCEVVLRMLRVFSCIDTGSEVRCVCHSASCDDTLQAQFLCLLGLRAYVESGACACACTLVSVSTTLVSVSAPSEHSNL